MQEEEEFSSDSSDEDYVPCGKFCISQSNQVLKMIL